METVPGRQSLHSHLLAFSSSQASLTGQQLRASVLKGIWILFFLLMPVSPTLCRQLSPWSLGWKHSIAFVMLCAAASWLFSLPHLFPLFSIVPLLLILKLNYFPSTTEGMEWNGGVPVNTPSFFFFFLSTYSKSLRVSVPYDHYHLLEKIKCCLYYPRLSYSQVMCNSNFSITLS